MLLMRICGGVATLERNLAVAQNVPPTSHDSEIPLLLFRKNANICPHNDSMCEC